MKKAISALIFTVFVCTITTAQNRVEPPKVISTTPSFGDCNVDPELTKIIIIKFDQDMSPGYSAAQTKNSPQVTGKPEWIDKRTFAIPVRLYPDKLYSLQLNNWKFHKFTNVEGIPLNPVDLQFQTKSDTSAVLSETHNKKAYNEFKAIFPKQYSYASLKGVDWKSILKKNRAELENAKTNVEFALKLVKMLRISEDPHLWVDVDNQRFEAGAMRITENNYGSKQLYSLLQDKKASNNFISVSGVIDSVGYISVREWSTDFNNLMFKPLSDSGNQEITAENALKELLRYPNLIIDVRENSGGNENYAKELASYFVKDTTPYEKVKIINEKTGSFDNIYVKNLYPNEKRFNYTGNIYVLSGPSVMSSNESFILMMKQLPNAKIVGMKSYGSSGNPIPYKLSNGVTVYLPSWQAYTLDGKLIEGNGVEPDIEIITSKKDYENKDVLVESVMKMIKHKN